MRSLFLKYEALIVGVSHFCLTVLCELVCFFTIGFGLAIGLTMFGGILGMTLFFTVQTVISLVIPTLLVSTNRSIVHKRSAMKVSAYCMGVLALSIFVVMCRNIFYSPETFTEHGGFLGISALFGGLAALPIFYYHVACKLLEKMNTTDPVTH